MRRPARAAKSVSPRQKEAGGGGAAGSGAARSLPSVTVTSASSAPGSTSSCRAFWLGLASCSPAGSCSLAKSSFTLHRSSC